MAGEDAEQNAQSGSPVFSPFLTASPVGRGFFYVSRKEMKNAESET